MSRATRRELRHELRRRGCTCSPSITEIGATPAEFPTATAGVVIGHTPGCPLGDRMRTANQLGLVPIGVYKPTRCAR